ncbi:NeuD/PglB/VioB family sugar acetyltransferase [Vibrio rotiferianus]|uniref:NeuD/PglB/VioB family sugar acetyltransferase n=1 Tax=Vibrio rotiferianus TaxID=190895 RepID=UPI0028946B5F|nr:Sugar O-acyltransferase (Sialic acid O-acetyltransferase NeuD family) [Vibrio rotiferianus]
MKQLYIIGSSGHAKVIIDAVEEQGLYSIAGLIDDFRTLGEETLGYAVVGGLSWLLEKAKHNPETTVYAFIAIGANYARKMINDRCAEAPNIKFVNVIHPTASVSKYAVVGDGCFIGAKSVVAVNSTLEEHVIVNHGASIDHDGYLAAYSSLAPLAALAGSVTVQSQTVIGIGAAVLEKRSVAANCVVAANATVIESVEESNAVMIGSPAKLHHYRADTDKYLD